MFYLTLPSNSSMVFFPDNNASHFVTKLPQPQELDGEYEVGLAELQFSNSYQNILKDEVYFSYMHFETIENESRTIAHTKILGQQKVYVPEGLYESNTYLIIVLNNLVSTRLPKLSERPVVKFKYNKATRKVTVIKFQNNSRLWLSEKLSDILGCPRAMQNKGQFEGTRSVDVDQNVKSIFVYTDLVQPRPVGDVVVPLLRSLPPVEKRKDTMHYMFEKPHYFPLARFQFDTVEILLTSDKGEPIPFDNGHSIVTLHFRRRRLV